MKCPTCSADISCLTCPHLFAEHDKEDAEIVNLQCAQRGLTMYSYYWRNCHITALDCVCDMHPVIKLIGKEKYKQVKDV
jgi:hypothetical protein